MKRLLLDTGVWITYFGGRPPSERSRMNLSKKIINYCIKEGFKLFYCPYVENELARGRDQSKTATNIVKMKKIANQVLAHTGNDTWDQIDVKWEEWGH